MLEKRLSELGYETLMREGTDLIRALYEANPCSEGVDSDTEKLQIMDRLYATSVFGSLAKHSQPIANLLAAAKKAGTMVSERTSVNPLSVYAHRIPFLLIILIWNHRAFCGFIANLLLAAGAFVLEDNLTLGLNHHHSPPHQAAGTFDCMIVPSGMQEMLQCRWCTFRQRLARPINNP